MKRFYLFLTLSFSCACLYSQQNFQPGYYLTNTNDTVFGLIDYQGDVENSKVCRFRKDDHAPITEFLPGTIKAYRFIDNKYYVSKPLPKDSAKTMVFMEYLIKGTVSVFFLRTNQDTYFIEKNGKMSAMKNDEIIEGQTYPKRNHYQGILRYYFQDAPSIFQEADNVTFDKKSFVHIAEKYDKKICNDGGQCIIYEKKPSKVIFHYGLYIGLTYCDMIIYQVAGFPFLSNSTSFTGGGKCQANIPAVNENLYAQLSLGIGNNSGQAVINSWNGNNYSNMNLNMHQSYYQTEFDLLYKFPLKKIKPNVSLGYTYNIVNSYNLNVGQLSVSKNDESYLFTGITIGGGIEMPAFTNKIYFISLKFERDNFLEGVNNVGLFLGYTLSTGILF